LTAKHTRADLIRSLLEGVSYSLNDCLQIIEGMGVPLNSVRLSGGGAQSPFWRQMLADVFDKRSVALSTQEGSAYGAALLAMVGTGEFPSVAAACQAVIHEVESISPHESTAAIYAKGHRIYQGLYSRLQPFYDEVAK